MLPLHILRILGLLLLMSATTARADITANFTSADQHQLLKVEIADNGTMRFTDKDGSYILVLNGQAYSVEAGPGGPSVTTVEAIGYLERQSIKNGEVIITSFGEKNSNPVRYIPSEEVKILGHDGVRYVAPGTQWTAYTLTKDSSLLPLGKAFAAYFDAIAKMSTMDRKEAVNRHELLATHGVLAYWQQELASLSFEPIAPMRFALPATPLTVADLAVGIGDAQSANAESPKRQASIVSVGMRGKMLLVLRDDGQMEAWAEGAIRGKPFETPGLVGSFCQENNSIYLATADKKKKTVTLWSGQPGTWSPVITLNMNEKDHFLALDCSGTEPLLLTTGALRFLRSGTTVAIQPKEPWSGGFVKTLQHGDYLYVGANKGEWGGGMRRVPLAGGAVEAIDGSDPKNLCGGLLNKDCDPVTGLSADPTNADCILAATGLVHMFSSGSVVRICNGKISLAYAKPYTVKLGWAFDAENWQEPMSSVPFYSATGNGSIAWVVGSDGIYEFTDAPMPAFTAFPRNYELPPSGVDWSNPKFVLISSDMNQRHSLSGRSLIMVPR